MCSRRARTSWPSASRSSTPTASPACRWPTASPASRCWPTRSPHFECRVVEHVTGGTHAVFLAEVHAARTREGVAPLAYFRGQFGRLELAQDAESYVRLRERLLDRSLPIGERLDADGLAEELGLSPKSVRRSLARLGGEGLVERDDAGGFFVEPLTFARVEDAFRARLAIQFGAAALTIGRVDAAQLGELRALMERTRAPAGARRLAGGEQPLPRARDRACRQCRRSSTATAG